MQNMIKSERYYPVDMLKGITPIEDMIEFAPYSANSNFEGYKTLLTRGIDNNSDPSRVQPRSQETLRTRLPRKIPPLLRIEEAIPQIPADSEASKQISQTELYKNVSEVKDESIHFNVIRQKKTLTSTKNTPFINI